MRKSELNEAQIIGILNEVEAGAKVAEVCRRHGISQPSYNPWKAKFGGMEVGEAQRLKALEDENRRLKQFVAELSLDNQALELIAKGKW